jgi:hypothetical protein
MRPDYYSELQIQDTGFRGLPCLGHCYHLRAFSVMAPQSNFMVVAPIDPDRMTNLRALLATMNHRRGVVNPQNTLVPFGQFDRLHFARFVILDDTTLDDISVYGMPRPDIGIALAFLGDCDGPAHELLADMVRRAGAGLRQIFSHCSGFSPDGDVLAWMRDHEQPPAALYVNWVGRSVRQVREESALRDALVSYLDANAAALVGKGPREFRDALRKFVDTEKQAGRLTLTPEHRPLSWKLGEVLHAAGVLLILLLLAPFLVLYLPVYLVQLRLRERRDPEIAPRPTDRHVRDLAELEDHDVANQFTAIGSLKPGLFRRWSASFFLWMLNNACRHVYNRGHLTRVGTIHFARWVFLDDKRRILFASNYDGSLESYMDDFINKVGWGLNLVFSNGVGYPHTDWLLLRGAESEQKFKHFLRRHELPTEVWYNAHPGLTAVDLDGNTRIRAGIEKAQMTDGEIGEWLQLF